MTPIMSWQGLNRMLRQSRGDAKEVLHVTAAEAINKALALPPLVLGLQQLPELQIRSPLNPTLHFLEETFWHREF